MKKVITTFIVFAFLLALGGVSAYALFGSESTSLIGATTTRSVVIYDMVKATNKTQLQFNTYSSKAIIRAKTGAGNSFIVLTTIDGSGATTTTRQYTVNTPYRYVYLVYSSVAKVAHSHSSAMFTW